MQLLRVTIRDNNIIKNSEYSSEGKARGGWDFHKTKTRDTKSQFLTYRRCGLQSDCGTCNGRCIHYIVKRD